MKSEKADTDEPEVITPPSPGDYLPEVIRKKVVETALTHPATIYPIALGIGSAAAGFILNAPIFYLTALTGLIGPVWAVMQIFFLNERIGKKYLKSLDMRRAKYKEQLEETLRKELQSIFATTRSFTNARQGLAQLEEISRILRSMQEVLGMKLGKSGYTFHRFAAAADQTYLSVLENLKDMAEILKIADAILPSGESGSRGGNAEAAPALWEEQMRKAEDKLAKNEHAITEMETISAKAACWQTDTRSADDDMESAIAELREVDNIITKVWMSSP